MTATGVVLMTYGAPRDAKDVPAYLARVRGGKAPTDELVREMTRRYERIGGSPLVRRTVAQAEALERELRARGGEWRAAAGMRFSDPSIASAVATLAPDVERVVGIVMSPQWSAALMGGYVAALTDAATAAGVAAHVADGWYRERGFVASVAERIGAALEVDARGAHVVMTAHSLPRRVYDAEPAYVAQLRETAELVAARAGLARDDWTWAYQSAGHTQEEWLRPDLVEVFPHLAAAGHRDVLVAPVQFLADHLEVLYDLDVAAAEQARAAGLRYHRIAMPNTAPTFIAALADVAERATRPLARSASGA